MRETDLRRRRNGLVVGRAPRPEPAAPARPPRTSTWCEHTDLPADTCHHCKETAMAAAAERARIRAEAFREAADRVAPVRSDPCGCGGCDECALTATANNLRQMADDQEAGPTS